MTPRDSDQDFLDKLYAQSAKEQPPADLDKRILEQAKARHQHKGFASTLHWQRWVSVAAVMVLSMYIFFDVRHDRPTTIDEAGLPPQKSLLKPAPSAPTSEHLERTEEGPSLAPTRQLKQKAAMQAVEPAFENYAADELNESGSEREIQTESQFPASQLSSSPNLRSEAAKAEQAQESPQADAMLEEIARLLSVEKQEEAKRLYEQFNKRFPDYPVPELIREAFNKDR